MPLMRILKDGPFAVNGQSVDGTAGALVRVDLRSEMQELLQAGVLGPCQKSHRPSRPRVITRVGDQSRYWQEPLPFGDRLLRVGIFLTNTRHYSGGRIHLYQYGWCLASTGAAEVFMISDLHPPWEWDYPPLANYHQVDLAVQPLPPDLDICVSDRNEKLRRALAYRDEHPYSLVMALNFETANWAEAVWPPLGAVIRRETVEKDYSQCDYLWANSAESRRWLIRHLEAELGDGVPVPPVAVLEPAVNTFALAKAEAPLGSQGRVGERPYALWVSRGVPHKCLRETAEMVWALDREFDLVVLGDKCLVDVPRRDPFHTLHFHKLVNDEAKFRLMLGAHTILCPSLFEGYGMVPGEALACGVRPLCFDLPVLRQAYGDRLHYVPHADFHAYAKAVERVAAEPKDTADAAEARRLYGMEAMRERVKALPCHNVGRISVSVHQILYWGFSPESLEAWYPFADQIIVAVGPTERVKAQGIEPDGSLERLRAFPDPAGKIEVHEREAWPDKKQMHDFCCRRIRGNRMVSIAGDLIWTGIQEWIEDAAIFSACPRIVHFYEDGCHYITDAGNWGDVVPPHGTFAPHYFYSYWKPSYRIRHHDQACDAAGRDLNKADQREERGLACKRHPGTIIYHLGNVLPQRIQKAKAQFYLDRDKATNAVRMSGDILLVDWELPPIVRRALDRVGASHS